MERHKPIEMIPYIALLFFSFLSKPAHSNSNRAFEKGIEAMEMVSLCNTFSFENYYGNIQAFVPFGYRFLGRTQESPLYNTIQFYRKNKQLVIVFRGTINETNSWLENLHFFQIPAKGELKVENIRFEYNFSEDDNAAVHSGYVLASYYLLEQIIDFFENSAVQGIEEIILTGHSQGGALAQMFLALMELNSDFSGYDLKSYSFGSPRIGNQAFADDFNRRFAVDKRSIRFVNPSDVVCNLPLANKNFTVNIKGFEAQIDLEAVNGLLQFGKHFLSENKRLKVDEVIENTKKMAADIIKEQIGVVEFPDFSNTVFYGETGEVVQLQPEPFPAYLELKIQEEETSFFGRMAKVQGSVKRELTFFQHSIFTYYNAIYKHYQPMAFRRVRLQVLPKKML